MLHVHCVYKQSGLTSLGWSDSKSARQTAGLWLYELVDSAASSCVNYDCITSMDTGSGSNMASHGCILCTLTIIGKELVTLRRALTHCCGDCCKPISKYLSRESNDLTASVCPRVRQTVARIALEASAYFVESFRSTLPYIVCRYHGVESPLMVFAPCLFANPLNNISSDRSIQSWSCPRSGIRKDFVQSNGRQILLTLAEDISCPRTQTALNEIFPFH